MKFDFVIGNPPYQESIKNQGDRAKPVYNDFMNAAYQVANTIELITPARFLFNAGQTSKAWNREMLDDEHLAVLFYEPDASKVFPSTDIKGGVVVTLYDYTKTYGAIGTFTPYKELNDIFRKVQAKTEKNLDEIVSSRGNYRLNAAFLKKYPDASKRVGVGTGNMIVSNIFDKIPEAFLVSKPNDIEEYLMIVGRTVKSRFVCKLPLGMRFGQADKRAVCSSAM